MIPRRTFTPLCVGWSGSSLQGGQQQPLLVLLVLSLLNKTRLRNSLLKTLTNLARGSKNCNRHFCKRACSTNSTATETCKHACRTPIPDKISIAQHFWHPRTLPIFPYNPTGTPKSQKCTHPRADLSQSQKRTSPRVKSALPQEANSTPKVQSTAFVQLTSFVQSTRWI